MHLVGVDRPREIRHQHLAAGEAASFFSDARAPGSAGDTRCCTLEAKLDEVSTRDLSDKCVWRPGRLNTRSSRACAIKSRDERSYQQIYLLMNDPIILCALYCYLGCYWTIFRDLRTSCPPSW